MTNSVRIAILLVTIFLYVLIFSIFRRGRIPLKFALVWIMPTTMLLLVSIVPDFLSCFTQLLGFQTISNMIVGILFVMLFFICIMLTIIVSGQNTKITLLIQEVSVLKKNRRKDEK